MFYMSKLTHKRTHVHAFVFTYIKIDRWSYTGTLELFSTSVTCIEFHILFLNSFQPVFIISSSEISTNIHDRARCAYLSLTTIFN